MAQPRDRHSGFIDPDQLAARERRPGITVRAARTEQLTLSHVTLQPNAVVPRHQHPEEQASIVLSGTLAMTIGPEMRLMMAGDSYLIPGGVEHGGRAGPEGASLVDVFTPARADYEYGASSGDRLGSQAAAADSDRT
ncbi:MAG: cupin domain-containing protein [Anaerolineales bacterium]|nr:cupin domain-containing protein [Anaerolineales bacterium]